MDTVIGILIWVFIIGGIVNYFVQERRKEAQMRSQTQDARTNSADN